MINDVLDIARIQSDRLELSPEPIQVATLLTETVGLMTPAAGVNRIEILFDPAQPAAHRYVRGDRRRLQQVLINLLANAIKYNRPDGRIDIDVLLADDKHLSIAVTDTGNGIAAADLPRLFQPFDRLGQQTSDIEGTGIGLALSHRLTTAMGGRLDVASTPGRGSTFTVTMPLTDPSRTTHPDSDTTREVPAVGHGTVLYIEDNHSNIDLLTAVLRLRPGWTMIHAGTGELGLELAATSAPTVILLDLHLPDIDGIDVLQALRTDPTTRRPGGHPQRRRHPRTGPPATRRRRTELPHQTHRRPRTPRLPRHRRPDARNASSRHLPGACRGQPGHLTGRIPAADRRVLRGRRSGPRRTCPADAVELIGAALTARASGLGRRRIAVWLGALVVSTVRGWLRRCGARFEAVRVHFTVLARLAGVDSAVPEAVGGRARGGGRGDGGGDRRPGSGGRDGRPGDGVAGCRRVVGWSASLTGVARRVDGCRVRHELPLTHLSLLGDRREGHCRATPVGSSPDKERGRARGEPLR